MESQQGHSHRYLQVVPTVEVIFVSPPVELVRVHPREKWYEHVGL
jgi:hypothetical protein